MSLRRYEVFIAVIRSLRFTEFVLHSMIGQSGKGRLLPPTNDKDIGSSTTNV